MNEEESIVINTYKRVWKIERILYKVDKFKLFRPLTYWQIGYFLIAAVAIIFINSRTGLLNFIPGIARYFMLPAFISFYLSKVKHDGKAPHRWLITYCKYLMAPRYYNRYLPLDLREKNYHTGNTTFRELYLREEARSSVTPGTTLQAEER